MALADELYEHQYYLMATLRAFTYWTDKDVQLWTETEHDLLRLIYETYITIILGLIGGI